MKNLNLEWFVEKEYFWCKICFFQLQRQPSEDNEEGKYASFSDKDICVDPKLSSQCLKILEDGKSFTQNQPDENPSYARLNCQITKDSPFFYFEAKFINNPQESDGLYCSSQSEFAF